MNNSQSARSEKPGRPRRALMDLLSVLSRGIPASYFAIVCIGFWKNFIQTGKWISLIIKEDEIYNAYRERVRYRMIPLISVNPTSGE